MSKSYQKKNIEKTCQMNRNKDIEIIKKKI